MKRHTRFPRWPSPLLLCAMLAAVLAGGCNAPVTVLGAQCTSKSYPSFWQTLDALKGDPT